MRNKIEIPDFIKNKKTIDIGLKEESDAALEMISDDSSSSSKYVEISNKMDEIKKESFDIDELTEDEIDFIFSEEEMQSILDESNIDKNFLVGEDDSQKAIFLLDEINKNRKVKTEKLVELQVSEERKLLQNEQNIIDLISIVTRYKYGQDCYEDIMDRERQIKETMEREKREQEELERMKAEEEARRRKLEEEKVALNMERERKAYEEAKRLAEEEQRRRFEEEQRRLILAQEAEIERRRIQEEQEELERLRKEKEELERLRLEQEEQDRLRKEKEELERLRLEAELELPDDNPESMEIVKSENNPYEEDFELETIDDFEIQFDEDESETFSLKDIEVKKVVPDGTVIGGDL